jgi:hypothetical protein
VPPSAVEDQWEAFADGARPRDEIAAADPRVESAGEVRVDRKTAGESVCAQATRWVPLALLKEAAALGIPWKEILEAEIVTSRALRRCRVTVEAESDPWQALCVLSGSALQSWRVRNWLETICWEARTGQSAWARRRLNRFIKQLGAGQTRDVGAPVAAARREHLRGAYVRVRELMTIGRAAEHAPRGTADERARVIESLTGCSREDAAWAVARATSKHRRRLNDALCRAREEGFQIPLASSELGAFRLLKRYAEASRQRRSVPAPAASRVRRGRRHLVGEAEPR